MHERLINDQSVTRRRFLQFALSGIAIGLLGSEEDKLQSLPLSTAESVVSLQYADEKRVGRHPFEGIDMPYLRMLLHELKQEKYDFEAKLSAVQRSRRVVEIYAAQKAVYAKGTAFQIDQSGIYITAGHVLRTLGVQDVRPAFDDRTMVINDPYSGAANRAQGFMLHRNADMGIIYAPTGYNPKPTEHMQIDTDSLAGGVPLWMIGLFPGVQLQEVQKFGTVIDHSDTLTFVEGMRPFGGTSGSPIIDARATIVGLEKGYYPGTATRYEVYEGATITPMKFIDTLDTEATIAYQM